MEPQLERLANLGVFERWLLAAQDPLPSRGYLCGLSDLGKSFFAGIYAHRHPQRTLWLIAESAHQARVLEQNLHSLYPDLKVFYYPHLEWDDAHNAIVNPEKVWDRHRALDALLTQPRGSVFLSTHDTLLQTLPSPLFFKTGFFTLKTNDEVMPSELADRLLRLGYAPKPRALDPGTFCHHHFTLDIFVPHRRHAVRIEFYGDYIDTMRVVDTPTQRSGESLHELRIAPVGCFWYPEDTPGLASHVRSQLDQFPLTALERNTVLDALVRRDLHVDKFWMYPYLWTTPGVSWDAWMPGETTLFFASENECNAGSLYRQLSEQASRVRRRHAYFPSDAQLLQQASFLDQLRNKSEVYQCKPLASHDAEDWTWQSESLGATDGLAPKKGQGLKLFAESVRKWLDSGVRVHMAARTRTHAERLGQLLVPYGIPLYWVDRGASPLDFYTSSSWEPCVYLWEGNVSETVFWPQMGWMLVREEDLLGVKAVSRAEPGRAALASDTLLTQFRDLRPSDIVVHSEYGLGRYLELKKMTVQGVDNDYFILEYQGGDKLYVPVYRLNVLERYSGAESAPKLDKLGTDSWDKKKQKAKQAASAVAMELLALQARRRAYAVKPLAPQGADFEALQMSFPYDETPDQARVIQEVLNDLEKKYPMDRLVCGDVGFGKTEVAIRACARVVFGGMQAAVLVPTTLLALQHGESFRKRFDGTPVRIEVVSRLHRDKEIASLLLDAAQGRIDILIGTHRLLSTDVSFSGLGLLVIDEEHRFGVVQKERLKQRFPLVHLLSLSATPIPRTLNMGLLGIKDISLLTSPPPDRRAVRTYVCRKVADVVSQAVHAELQRGGQVFYVHNRIESQPKEERWLRETLPDVSMLVVHGRMSGPELEEKMLQFYHQQASVLLTTAIIESGLDLPTANTIIIDDAHQLGLAQLYQLRGRVGRSDKRAHCYLLTPAESTLDGDAKARLQTIQRYSDLGSGLQIAHQDLDIRGAGELLGEEQSGMLSVVGVELYFDLLAQSVAELTGHAQRELPEPELSVPLAGYLPDDYVVDVGEKLQLYRRLSLCRNEDALAEMELEMRDRFGPLPQPVFDLLQLLKLKLVCRQMEVRRISVGKGFVTLQWPSRPHLNADALLKCIAEKKWGLKLVGPDHKLSFPLDPFDPFTLHARLRELADRIAVNPKEG